MPKPPSGPSPARTDVDILKAKSSMTELLGNQEKCYMDPDLASDVGVSKGDQVRIRRSSSQYAIYTVADFYEDGTDNDDVRMALAGRQKLGTSDSMTNVDLYAPDDTARRDLTDAEAEQQSEFVERLDDDGSHTGLVALAPHGGYIENWTDEQAERVASQLASKGVSCWRCKGWKDGGGAYDRWHITSTAISRNSFPLLDSIGDRGFTYSVAFHGFSSGGVLIGGGGPMSVKESIRDAIVAAVNDPNVDVTIADEDDAFNGDDPANLTNWLTANGAGGIQIEQSSSVRSNYWQEIADAVASVFDALI